MHNRLYLILLIFIFYFTNNNTFSQTVKGQIIDAKTKVGIPFATVYHPKSYVGLHTSEEGEFNWNIRNMNDTIIVSSVGYKTLQVSVKNFQKDIINLITLDEQSTALAEISINATKPKKNKKNVEVEMGYYNFKKSGKSVMRPGGITNLEIYATYLPNQNNIKGFLKEVKYDLSGFSKFGEAPRVRVRILAFNKQSGIPDKDLLQANLLLKVNKLSSNIIVDLSDYNIDFPSDGLCIALEFFCRSTWELTNKNRSEEHSNCPYLPLTKIDNRSDDARSYYWTFHSGKWKWVSITDGTVFRPGLMFKFGAVIATTE